MSKPAIGEYPAMPCVLYFTLVMFLKLESCRVGSMTLQPLTQRYRSSLLLRRQLFPGSRSERAMKAVCVASSGQPSASQRCKWSSNRPIVT